MRRLCATVLIMEAIVIGLAIPVALTVEHASRRPAALAGGVLVAAAVLLAVLAARGPLRLVLAGGSLLQVLVLAASRPVGSSCSSPPAPTRRPSTSTRSTARS